MGLWVRLLAIVRDCGGIEEQCSQRFVGLAFDSAMLLYYRSVILEFDGTMIGGSRRGVVVAVLDHPCVMGVELNLSLNLYFYFGSARRCPSVKSYSGRKRTCVVKYIILCYISITSLEISEITASVLAYVKRSLASCLMTFIGFRNLPLGLKTLNRARLILLPSLR